MSAYVSSNCNHGILNFSSKNTSLVAKTIWLNIKIRFETSGKVGYLVKSFTSPHLYQTLK